MAYVVGSNMPGYMPDSEPWATSSWFDAQAAMIDELLRDADTVEDESIAEELTAAAEDLNLCQGDSSGITQWFEIIDNRSYWIVVAEEEVEVS